MRIAFITAGAAGMYCGSCMRDNTLVAALRASSATTRCSSPPTRPSAPTRRTSARSASSSAASTSTSSRSSGCSATRRGSSTGCSTSAGCCAGCRGSLRRTQYSELGELTVSMLQGTHGKQRKEVASSSDWLADGREARRRAAHQRAALGRDSRGEARAWTCRSSSRCRATTSSSTHCPRRPRTIASN